MDISNDWDRYCEAVYKWIDEFKAAVKTMGYDVDLSEYDIEHEYMLKYSEVELAAQKYADKQK